MSRFFQLGHDSFHHLLSWLDLASICTLDTAIGSKDERSLWLHSLHTMDSKAVDEYGHSHLSIRWLISRGARATKITIRRRKVERDGVTNETFAGVGILSSQGTHTDDSDFTLNTDYANTSRSHIAEMYESKSCDITTDINMNVSVRPRSRDNLTSIDLTGCQNISNEGVTAIAEGCHKLTSINLSGCSNISNVVLSTLAEGCHQLTSIDLSHCDGISDEGLLALAERCHQLTSINLYFCSIITDIGISALAEGCHQLTSINLSYCHRISDIGVSALAEGCRQLTSINLSFCNSISDIGVSADRKSVV